MKMKNATMMHCDTKLLPAVIDYAQQLLEDYSESEFDESVSYNFLLRCQIKFISRVAIFYLGNNFASEVNE